MTDLFDQIAEKELCHLIFEMWNIIIGKPDPVMYSQMLLRLHVENTNPL